MINIKIWSYSMSSNTMVLSDCDFKDCSTSTFQNRRSHLWVIKPREPKGLSEEETMNEHQFIQFCQAGADEVWAHRGGTRTDKCHVSGVELKAADRSWMFAIQHSHLHPILGAPDMDSPILWACTIRGIQTQILQKWTNPVKLSNRAHRSWQTASREWSMPPGTTLYYCYSPTI